MKDLKIALTWKFRGSCQWWSIKKCILQNFAKFTAHVFFRVWDTCEALTQVFSYEFCGVFKNTFFIENFRATPSKHFPALSSSLSFRSRHRRCSVKKIFFEILQNSQEKTCARVSFLNKVAGLRLGDRCFPVNFANFLRTPFLREHFQATASQAP